MTAALHGTEVQRQNLPPQPVLSLRTRVALASLGHAQDDMLRTLAAFLPRAGAQVAGPPFVRYHAMDDAEADVELGVPVLGAVAGEGRVVSGELPGGPAVTTWHLGAHDRLGEAYARLRGWMSAQGHEPRGAAWEVYTWIDALAYHGPQSWPDARSWRTQLVWPISESGHDSSNVDTRPR